MKSVTHNGREFLFVEVPEDAGVFKISGTGWLCYKYRHTDSYWKVLSQPNEDYAGYRILCKASEAGEGIAESIIRRSRFIPNKPDSPFCYFDYCNTGTWFLTAAESLHSLILSLGMEVGRTIILEKLK